MTAALGASEMHDGPGPSTEQPDASSPRAETPGTDAADAADAADGLCERDRELLAFERHWWRHAGAKEQAIREQFGMSATRYYQLLNVLLDRPEALVADPMLVKRLRRLRSSRQKARAARRGGGRS